MQHDQLEYDLENRGLPRFKDMSSKLWTTGCKWLQHISHCSWPKLIHYALSIFHSSGVSFWSAEIQSSWTSKIIITIAIQRFWIIGRSSFCPNRWKQLFRKLLVLKAANRHISILIAVLILIALGQFRWKRCPFPYFSPWVCRPSAARRISFST